MGVDWLDVGPFALMPLAAGSTGYQIDANLDRFDAPRTPADKAEAGEHHQPSRGLRHGPGVGSAVKLCATPPASV